MKSLTKHLNNAIRKRDFTVKESVNILDILLNEETSVIQSGALLTALATKGEHVLELSAFAEALHKRMIKISNIDSSLDIVGTGGDSYDTINVSTLASFVCASLGVPIAKHGTRALSSKCGSFDVLEKLGVPIPESPQEAKKIFQKNGIVFLFAPYFHPAFKAVHELRRELGIRTIFNLIGPMLNPGNVKYQVIGVSKEGISEMVGNALIGLGRKRVLVVRSQDGLDEVSTNAPTDIYDFAPGRKTKHLVFTPKKLFPLKAVQGGSPQKNVRRFKAILAGKGTNAENEFVAMNAALGLYAYGKVNDIEIGRKMALEALLSGSPLKIMNSLIESTI